MLRHPIFLTTLVCFSFSCSSPPTTAPSSEKAAPKVEADGATAHLERSANKPLYNLENIGSVVNPFDKQPVAVPVSGNLTVIGWAVDGATKSAAGGVDVLIDGQPYKALAGRDRADVADFYKVPAYAKAGFNYSAPASAFGRGKHAIAVRVISNDGKTYSEGLDLTIDIR
jgi:hypothetical protein